MKRGAPAFASFTHTEGIVLSKRPTSDTYARLEVLTPQYGKLHCYYATRQSRQLAAFDLLDHVDLTLKDRSGGQSSIIQESTVMQRFYGLTRNYTSFLRACQFANSISNSLQVLHCPSPELYTLLQKALQAWDSGKQPEEVFFKAVFFWIKREGYPIVQEWAHALAPEDQALVQSLLTKAQPAAPLLPRRIELLNTKLLRWAESSTDLLMA